MPLEKSPPKKVPEKIASGKLLPSPKYAQRKFFPPEKCPREKLAPSPPPSRSSEKGPPDKLIC